MVCSFYLSKYDPNGELRNGPKPDRVFSFEIKRGDFHLDMLPDLRTFIHDEIIRDNVECSKFDFIFVLEM